MSGWIKGQPWRVVRSLDRLHAQVRAAYPRAVPPATPASSWGSIADDAHSSTSDHFPKVYAALGKTAVVTARDFPHAPALGLDFGEVAEALRVSRDPRIKYVIFDGRMFSSYAAHGYAPFTWRPCSGKDMHRTHGHVSSVSTTVADDARDWQIGDDMLTDEQMDKIAAKAASKVWSAPYGPTEDTADVLSSARVEAREAAKAAKAALDALAARPPVEVDYDQLADAIVRRVFSTTYTTASGYTGPDPTAP